ncbi:MAG: acetyl-CoA carboxylase biotin carboxyl carrier protein [Candidatus Saccharicenans sp.]
MTQKSSKSIEVGETISPTSKINFEELRRLIALLEEKNLSLFELEVEDFKIKISRNQTAPIAQAPLVIAPAGAEAPTTAPASGSATPQVKPAEDKNIHYITSPMVGTFYRAPSPTSPPFVDIGDTVKKGQTLCIIEAMKLMNEIESDVNGIVVDILVENGKPVEYGQKLFAIKVSS